MKNPLEIMLIERDRLIVRLDDNNSPFDRQYINLKIENINLQMQVYHLQQPAIQKAMLATPKMLVIKGDKTLGEIEEELITKAKAYDKLMSVDSGEAMECFDELCSYLDNCNVDVTKLLQWLPNIRKNILKQQQEV